MSRATVTVPISQFTKALQRRMRSDAEILREVALDAANYGVAFAVQLTDDQGLVDQGLFRWSWGVSDTPDGVELQNTAPYSGVIEHGRRPGQPGPPFEPIYEWVLRKLVPNGVVLEAEAEQAAWAIRNAIHERGTKPRKILQITMEEVRAYIVREGPARLQRG